MRGIVQEYNARRSEGLILPDEGGSPLPFSHLNYDNIETFEVGDKVEFNVEGDIERLKLKLEKCDFSGLFSLLLNPSQGNKAVHVQIYETATCRRYLLRRETTVKFVKDYGVARCCKKCSAIVSHTGKFGEAYQEYREGKMPAEVAREFEQALVDRTKISNFLNRKYVFH